MKPCLDDWPENCPVCEKKLGWWIEGEHQFCDDGGSDHEGTGHYGAILGDDGKIEPIISFTGMSWDIKRFPPMTPGEFKRFLKLTAFE